MEKSEYPMRINKYLALHNYSTRLGGDVLVKNKQVKINDKLAVLGSKVNQDDVVEVLNFKNPKTYRYYVYNKPVGVITHSPQNGEKDIKDSISLRDVAPIGRLDKNSRGLIILTNDGRITNRLLSPEFSHEKEYIVTTSEKLRPSFKQYMEAGVDIGGYITKKCKVTMLGDFKFKIILTEGKKHQIRRMCDALHNKVKTLERIRIMNIKLGTLASGKHRPIEGDELKTFMKDLGF
jgi:23S rRNA pseudouridine2604 synthase